MEVIILHEVEKPTGGKRTDSPEWRSILSLMPHHPMVRVKFLDDWLPCKRIFSRLGSRYVVIKEWIRDSQA
jgi:hypothetical protein